MKPNHTWIYNIITVTPRATKTARTCSSPTGRWWSDEDFSNTDRIVRYNKHSDIVCKHTAIVRFKRIHVTGFRFFRSELWIIWKRWRRLARKAMREDVPRESEREKEKTRHFYARACIFFYIILLLLLFLYCVRATRSVKNLTRAMAVTAAVRRKHKSFASRGRLTQVRNGTFCPIVYRFE